MVLTDSSLALLIKPQVLITTILASSFIASCVTSLPLAFSCPISTSLSYTFLEQPNVTTLILFFFNDLVLIPLKLRGQNYDFNLRSEEHTSELQSRPHLVCRLLLEK